MQCMAKRLSVILGNQDEQRVLQFASPGTPEREALQSWVAQHGGGKLGSEAAVIRALVHAGAFSLQEELLDAGYAEMAGTYADEDEDRRAVRRRYIERTEAIRE